MEEKAIQIRNLMKVYKPDFFSRDGAVTALANVTLEVEKGKLYTLLGPNGSGKTTLLRILAGLIPPTEGEAKIAGVSVRNQNRVSTKIGFLNTGEAGLLDFMSGLENLELFAVLQEMEESRARKRITDLVERFALGDYLNRRVKTYSSGIRQRFLVVRTLLHDPEVVLLDEPIVHLDPIAMREFYSLLCDELVGRLKKTVLLTTHQLEGIPEISDTLGFLFKGRLVWEKPADVFQSRQQNLFNEYLTTVGGMQE